MAGEFVIKGWMDYGENRDVVLAAFVECARASRDEPGCLDYWVAADPDDPGRLYVYEQWSSEAELAAHFRTEHIARFRTAIDGYARSGRELHRIFVDRSEPFSSSMVPTS